MTIEQALALLDAVKCKCGDCEHGYCVGAATDAMMRLGNKIEKIEVAGGVRRGMTEDEIARMIWKESNAAGKEGKG